MNACVGVRFERRRPLGKPGITVGVTLKFILKIKDVNRADFSSE
jgi:hypothetical protein